MKHYLEEKDRQPSVHEFVKNGKSMPGHCIDGGAAVHFKNEKYDRTLSFYPDGKAFYVEFKNEEVIETELSSIIL